MNLFKANRFGIMVDETFALNVFNRYITVDELDAAFKEYGINSC